MSEYKPPATIMQRELVEALGTLLDLIQFSRLLDKVKLSERDLQDFVRAKKVHSKWGMSEDKP